MNNDFNELIKQAARRNINVRSGIYKPADSPVSEIAITDYELQRRISEHDKDVFLRRTTLASMIVSIISALAAWAAVATSCH